MAKTANKDLETKGNGQPSSETSASPATVIEAPRDKAIIADEQRGAGRHESGFNLGHDEDPLRLQEHVDIEERNEVFETGDHLKIPDNWKSERFHYRWILGPWDAAKYTQRLQQGYEPVKRENVQSDEGFPTGEASDIFNDHGFVRSGSLILARCPVERWLKRQKRAMQEHIRQSTGKARLTRRDIEDYIRSRIRSGQLDPRGAPDPRSVADRADVSRLMDQLI